MGRGSSARLALAGLGAVFAAAVAALAVVGACNTRAVGGANVYCDPTHGDACYDPVFKTCDPRTKLCVECSEAVPCGADRPVCDRGAGGLCRACAGASPSEDALCAATSSAAPRCQPSTGRCVACRPDTQATDCPVDRAVCDAATLACRPCQSNGECASGVCEFTDVTHRGLGGRCAAAGDVLYVDLDHCPVGDGGVDGGDGSRAAPFCQIATAFARSAGRPDVLVAGSKQRYAGFVVGADVRLVGPGRAAAVPAIVNGSQAPAIEIDAGHVILDGVSLAGSLATLLSCKGGTVVVEDARFVGGAQHVDASCDLTLDQAELSGSSGSSIHFRAGATFTLENAFFTQNGQAANALVSVDSGATGRAAFVTAVDNRFMNQFGGFDCGGGPGTRVIENSIFQRDSLSGSNFIGNCTLVNVVSPYDSYPGAITDQPPSFDPNRPLRLAADATCCIDKAVGPDGGATVPLPDHDGDGLPRPSGNGFDIGASEYQAPK